MTVELNMTLFDVNTHREFHEDGYVFADYFTDKGWQRAQGAASASEADRILSDTYKGADVDGIGLRWTAVE